MAHDSLQKLLVELTSRYSDNARSHWENSTEVALLTDIDTEEKIISWKPEMRRHPSSLWFLSAHLLNLEKCPVSSGCYSGFGEIWVWDHETNELCLWCTALNFPAVRHLDQIIKHPEVNAFPTQLISLQDLTIKI